MKRFFVIFLIIYATKCCVSFQEAPMGGRIVGSNFVFTYKYPYMVGIDSFERNCHETASFCGGSLISSTWVLTAAHCVYDKDCHLVYMGSIFLDEATIAYRVLPDKVQIHHNFNYNSQANDIALIKIPETEFCYSISAAKLPAWAEIYETFAGHYAISIGWGSIRTNGPMSNHLKFINRSIISNELCRSYKSNLYPELLCLDASESESICTGDSGGPLVLDSTQELIAIAVGVSKDGCEAGTPNFFVRITEYFYWIQQITSIFSVSDSNF